MSRARTVSGLIVISLLLAIVGSGLIGCSFDGRPKRRIGSLPFPGVLTRYRPLQVAEARDLGVHQYAWLEWRDGVRPEVDHGILYTCRAGFLDLAHLRTVVDWTKYCADRTRAAIAQDEAAFRVYGPDDTHYIVELEYPREWASMEDGERAAWAHHAALRTGQRLAYLMATWHEIATWFGYQLVPMIREDISAFTYDDTMAHVVGVRVAERALLSETSDFDLAVTEALLAELEELEAVERKKVREATRLVRGSWWSGRHPLVRHVDVGYDDGRVTPFLVAELGVSQGEPEPFVLPWLGEPGADAAELTVSTRLLVAPKIMAAAGQPRGERTVAESDIGVILEAIEREAEMGK